jgi:hypothetical protein
MLSRQYFYQQILVFKYLFGIRNLTLLNNFAITFICYMDHILGYKNKSKFLNKRKKIYYFFIKRS